MENNNIKRDKYGNYVNEQGVIIKINTDKNGKDHISFYGSDVDKPHDAAHVDIDYKKETWKTNTHGPDKSDTSNSSGDCYLTTACMQHYLEEFDDNCYELSMLRWFRDNFVSKSDITHYYEIAPIIVENIEMLENNEIIFNYIYDTVIAPCVRAIEIGDFEFAYNRYKNSILCLEEEFGIKEIKKGHVKSLGTIHKIS